MNQNYFIQSYCHIKNNTVSLNGKMLFSSDDREFSGFIKAAAIHMNTNYPKFYKMDALSKLAFLAADIVLNEDTLKVDEKRNIALIFSNKASSLDTDRKYQASISEKDNYYPSPSVFVYTLPNIFLGEISIRHRLHSENCFFIFENFSPKDLYINADYLLKTKKAEQVLCGWVDFDDKNYEAFLYLVSENGNIAHHPDEISQLYHLKL